MLTRKALKNYFLPFAKSPAMHWANSQHYIKSPNLTTLFLAPVRQAKEAKDNTGITDVCLVLGAVIALGKSILGSNAKLHVSILKV